MSLCLGPHGRGQTGVGVRSRVLVCSRALACTVCSSWANGGGRALACSCVHVRSCMLRACVCAFSGEWVHLATPARHHCYCRVHATEEASVSRLHTSYLPPLSCGHVTPSCSSPSPHPCSSPSPHPSHPPHHTPAHPPHHTPLIYGRLLIPSHALPVRTLLFTPRPSCRFSACLACENTPPHPSALVSLLRMPCLSGSLSPRLPCLH